MRGGSGAQAVGLEVVDDAPAAPATKGTLITDAIAEYLAEVKEAKAQKTLLAYTLTLNLFTGASQSAYSSSTRFAVPKAIRSAELSQYRPLPLR